MTKYSTKRTLSIIVVFALLIGVVIYLEEGQKLIGTNVDTIAIKEIQKTEISTLLPLPTKLPDTLNTPTHSTFHENDPKTKKPEAQLDPSCPSDLLFKPHENDRHRNITLRFGSKYTKYEGLPANNDTVVILVPVSNAARYMTRLMKNLCSLTYPHDKISIVLGEDSSTDNTYSEALKHLSKIENYFRNTRLVSLKGRMPPRPASARHELGFQLARRGHLARSRNQLLFAGLQDETWVLWMDSDVYYIPPDLIEHLMSTKKEIVAPACMYVKDSGKTDVYDRNTWKETKESLAFQQSQRPNYLMLEGYKPTMRKYLPDLRGDPEVVEIDGVGGCILLVKADVHRDGVIFPPFIFQHHIETEGLAKIGREMGYISYGMPYVEVFHS